jgi:hypothetical protein
MVVPTFVPSYTERSLRTAFAINPSAVLDHISDAAFDHEHNSELIEILASHKFIDLIGSIMTSPHASDNLREQATWALAILLTASNDDLSDQVNEYCLDNMDVIMEMLVGRTWSSMEFAVAQGQGSVAYLLNNWTLYYELSDCMKFLNILDQDITMLPDNCLVDYFAILTRIFYKDYPVSHKNVYMFLQIGTEKNCWRHRSKIARQYAEALGNLCFRDKTILPNNYENVFKCCIELHEHVSRQEVYYILSNLLCEPGAADMFELYGAPLRHRLYTTVRNSVKNGKMTNAAYQALWALANWTVNVTTQASKESVILDNELRYLLESHKSLDFVQSALTALAIYRAELREDSTAPIIVIEDNNSIEGHSEAADPDTHRPISPIPSALDLLMVDVPFAPSQTVRNLVNELKIGGVNSLVQIPTDAVFTYNDLAWIETAGYAIYGGKFGINPSWF